MPGQTWQDALNVYDQIVARSDRFERKGKSMPYTSSNGYMFSLLNKDAQLGIRLPKALQQEFLATYESGPFRSHGAVMRDYVLVPDELLEHRDVILMYLEKAFDYVNSLPPK